MAITSLQLPSQIHGLTPARNGRTRTRSRATLLSCKHNQVRTEFKESFLRLIRIILPHEHIESIVSRGKF